MKMAFPRQREAHVYKQKLLPEDKRGESVDLMRLKKESIRQEIEKSLIVDSMAIDTENINSRVNFDSTPLLIAPY